MRRLLLLAATVTTTVALAACAAPTGQPCYWHNGVRYTHLNSSGELLVVCEDGTVIVRKP